MEIVTHSHPMNGVSLAILPTYSAQQFIKISCSQHSFLAAQEDSANVAPPSLVFALVYIFKFISFC